MSNIWVYCELYNNAPAAVTLELLAKARELADKNKTQVVALLLGHNTQNNAQHLLVYGADKVIRVESENLAEYKPVPFAATLEKLARKYQPSVLLFGATALGRDLAPRVQAKLDTGLTADCLDLAIDDSGLLVQTKPSYGDDIMCTITCDRARPQMATVRPKVFTPLQPLASVKGEIIDEAIDVEADASYEILGREPIKRDNAGITEAEIIVAIGRGALNGNAVAAAQKLAARLGGVLAITRPLSDDGAFSHDLVIGQSGQTVKPKCIINVGVSGAIQYVVGMQNAGLIISINNNEDAAIFSSSHYGVAASAEEMLNAILHELAQEA